MQFILKEGDWDFIRSALDSARFRKFSSKDGQDIIYRLDPNHNPIYTDNEAKICIRLTYGPGDACLETDSHYIRRIYKYMTMNGEIKLDICPRIVSSIYRKQEDFAEKYYVSMDKPADYQLIIRGRRIDVNKAYKEIKNASYSEYLPKNPKFFRENILDGL